MFALLGDRVGLDIAAIETCGLKETTTIVIAKFPGQTPTRGLRTISNNDLIERWNLAIKETQGTFVFSHKTATAARNTSAKVCPGSNVFISA